MVIESFLRPCLLRQQFDAIHPKQKKYIYPSSSATSPTLISIQSRFIDLHLPIPITYLAGYPPAHTPSGESLTDLIHRVTSGLIINILPYPCRPFHPPPLDLNDHRALLWNRPFVAPFQTKPLASYPSTPDRLTHLRFLLVTWIVDSIDHLAERPMPSWIIAVDATAYLLSPLASPLLRTPPRKVLHLNPSISNRPELPEKQTLSTATSIYP
jgi:hypothetical protein